MLLPILLFLFFLKEFSTTQQCQSRRYDNDGTVCVCNSTYCDTIPRPQKVKPPQLLLYTSNKSGLRFHQTSTTFTSSKTKKQIVIDGSRQFQTILGWGGAFTDSTGININSLPKGAQTNLLKSYFSEDGIEYNLCRVPMGGSDFSVRAYTYDDGPPDPSLLNFELKEEDFLYKVRIGRKLWRYWSFFQIPYIQKASNLTDDLWLFATPWAAPKWMKTNNDFVKLGFIRKPMFQSWANYFVKFLDEYRKRGIKFWGVTTGNEPTNGWLLFGDLEVVAWPAWLIGEWIENNLGPTIRSSNHSDIKIMVLDDQRAYLPWYVVKALTNNVSRGYVDGIAVHWYIDEYLPPVVLSTTHKIFPDKFLLSTEASITDDGAAVKLGSWKRGEKYSVDIIQNWVSGWVDWNMVLDLQGGPTYIDNYLDSPIIVNVKAGEFYKQPTFYHLGHFSKFIPRGSVRIYSKLCLKNVKHVAFRRPDNGTVIIILNRNKKIVPLTLNDSSRGTAHVELSEESITTIVYW
ncbi:lysosomal acid glucosylceramidase-like isoform X2 [Zophobas morio]|uniref:lysosomal acid glucosylceramidase-like isoform X2 n=1 Tax=Zophobas morio TaxID=2755281 RepID=UPI003083C80B